MVSYGSAELESTGPLAAIITSVRVVLHVNPRDHGYRLENPRGMTDTQVEDADYGVWPEPE